MALQCSIQFYRNYAEVVALNDASMRSLRVDISEPYCRIFETTKQQCRDYVREIQQWTEGRPANLDRVVRSLMMDLCVRRRAMGMKH